MGVKEGAVLITADCTLRETIAVRGLHGLLHSNETGEHMGYHNAWPWTV